LIIKIKEKGETLCSQCGLILNEKEIDLSHNEKRFYNKEEKYARKRTGPPISPLLPDIGLCTFINRKEIYNKDLKRAAMRDTYLSWKNRNLLIATRELNRLSHNLNLPAYIKSSALNLYKKAFKKKLIKGRTIIGMIAACVHYSCKQHHIPRTFQEILDEISVSRNSLKLCYRCLVKTLNLKVPVSDPIAMIPHFIGNLGLNFDIEKISINILKSHLKNSHTTGINPRGLCAGAIYLVSKLKNIKIKQKEIAEVIGVTEVTLRARYKEIMNEIKFVYS